MLTATEENSCLWIGLHFAIVTWISGDHDADGGLHDDMKIGMNVTAYATDNTIPA